MHSFLRIAPLAAVMIANFAAAAFAEQVQLGRPLALESAEAPAAAPSESYPDAPAGVEGEAADDRAADHKPVHLSAAEAISLGAPQRLLAIGSPSREERGASAIGDGPKTIVPAVGNHALQTLAALAVVLALLFGLRAVFLRSGSSFAGGGRPSGVIEILARYPIARGQRLILLKMARRVLLLHQSGPSMTTLSEVKDPDEVAAVLARVGAGAASGREASRFRTLLSQFQREHDSATPRSKQGEIKDAWNDGEVVDLTKRPRRGFAQVFLGSERRT